MSMKMDDPSNDRESLTTSYGIAVNSGFLRAAVDYAVQQAAYFLKN
jgi:hypothetical protein